MNNGFGLLFINHRYSVQPIFNYSKQFKTYDFGGAFLTLFYPNIIQVLMHFCSSCHPSEPWCRDMLRPQVREVIRLHSTSCPPQPQVGCQFNEQTNCPAIWATGQMRRFRTVCIPSAAGRGLGCNRSNYRQARKQLTSETNRSQGETVGF